MLEGSLAVLPARETLSFVSLRGDFNFYIYTHTFKGSFCIAFSERAGSGGQRELHLEGLGKLAVWMLSQRLGFVHGSMKDSALSVTGVEPPSLLPFVSRDMSVLVLDLRKVRNS